MRIEWDAQTRARITTAFFVSFFTQIVLIIFSMMYRATGFGLTFGIFPEVDYLILRVLFIANVWVLCISGGAHIIGGVVKGRRVNTLKKMIEETEIPEPVKHLESYMPPYMLADSFDRSVLGAIYDLGGDYLSVSTKLYRRALSGSPVQLNNLLVKLYVLGLVDFDWDYEQIVLTSMGLDAVNIPVSLFATKIPPPIWGEVLVMKRAIRSSDWKGAVIGAARALEAAMRDKLAKVQDHNLLRNLDINKITLSEGINLLADTKAAKVDPLIRSLFHSIRLIRNPQVHYTDRETGNLQVDHSDRELDFGVRDASNCDIYLSLLLRAWYSAV